MPVFAVVIHGIAALLIILVILALIVLGAVTVVRWTARGAKRVAGSDD